MIVILALALLIISSTGSALNSLYGGLPGAFLGIIYLIMAVVYFFPVLFLYRFSSEMKLALQEGNTDHMTQAFKNMKSLFQFIGILTIIVIALYVLAIIFGALAAVFVSAFQ